MRMVFFRNLVFLLLFDFTIVEAGVFRSLKEGLSTYNFYMKVHHKEIVDVTNDLIKYKQLDPVVEKAIRIKGRRVFLFEYPSGDMKVKGYVSFVPSCKKQKLLIFVRGGSGIYRIRFPGNRANFWGDHTIISTTYRGGPSPGRDEFGGSDVEDLKCLIDFIPSLEKKLGKVFTAKEKIAVSFSRGAMQFFSVLKQHPELKLFFNRAVSVCGLLDLEDFLNTHPSFEKMIRLFLLQKPSQEWKDLRNPVHNAVHFPKNLPLLIVQGGKDKIIDSKVGKNMFKRLKSLGCLVEYQENSEAGHCSHVLDSLILDWIDS